MWEMRRTWLTAPRREIPGLAPWTAPCGAASCEFSAHTSLPRRPQNQATRFGLIFPIGGDVRDHAFGKCNFLDFARHVSQVNQKAIHLCHPRKWILFSQARKRPPQIKRPDCKRFFDHSHLAVDGAFANSECGAQVYCRHVR